MATAEALARRSRRRARRKLLIEAGVVLGLTAVGAVIVYFVYRHSIGSPWKVAGTDIQDIFARLGVSEVAVGAVAGGSCWNWNDTFAVPKFS